MSQQANQRESQDGAKLPDGQMNGQVSSAGCLTDDDESHIWQLTCWGWWMPCNHTAFPVGGGISFDAQHQHHVFLNCQLKPKEVPVKNMRPVVNIQAPAFQMSKNGLHTYTGQETKWNESCNGMKLLVTF